MTIVGAGEAGCRAALGLRKNGYKGPITLVGGESHIPYERPPLSKSGAGDAGITLKPISTKEELAGAEIAYISSANAVAIDRARKSVRLCRGDVIAYEKLLLATGASAKRLINAPEDARVLTIRTWDDAQRFHERVRPGARIAMIGAGFIGLELAAVARQKNADVTVIEAQSRILSRGVPEAIAAILATRHAKEGVRVLTGVKIRAIEAAESYILIHLSNQEAVAADLVVLGVGASPNTELAVSGGLACNNGIEVDATLQTSDQHIFAAGDCCSFPAVLYGGKRIRLESWRNAQEQGEHAARAMLGDLDSFNAVPWFWSDQYDLGLQVVGLSESGDRIVERRGANGELIAFHLAADGALVAASGIANGTAIAKDIKVTEAMIRGRVHPDPAHLANSAIRLKSLLQ